MLSRRLEGLALLLAVGLCSEAAPAEEHAGYVGQALLVGVERYENLPVLDPTVSNDILLMRDTLLRVGYDPNALHVLTNSQSLGTEEWVDYEEQLGRSQIQKAIDGLKSGYPVTLFYFSGHGAAFGSARHMATQDSDPARGNSYLAVNQIARDLFDKMGSENKVLVIDACSNAALKTGESLSVSEDWGINQIFSSRLGQKSQLLGEQTLSLFDARAQRAPRRGVSLFTKLFSESLLASSSDFGDSWLSVESVFGDVEARMSEYWRSSNGAARTLSCRSLGIGAFLPAGDPFGGARLPTQCPAKMFFGSSSGLLGKRPGGVCDQLKRTDGESFESFVDRQRDCLVKKRSQ